MRRNGFCPPRQQMFFRVFEVSKDCYPARSFGARIQSSTRTTGNEEADRLRCEVEAQGCPPTWHIFALGIKQPIQDVEGKSFEVVASPG